MSRKAQARALAVTTPLPRRVPTQRAALGRARPASEFRLPAIVCVAAGGALAVVDERSQTPLSGWAPTLSLGAQRGAWMVAEKPR
jgi:hypothetical protein